MWKTVGGVKVAFTAPPRPIVQRAILSMKRIPTDIEAEPSVYLVIARPVGSTNVVDEL